MSFDLSGLFNHNYINSSNQSAASNAEMQVESESMPEELEGEYTQSSEAVKELQNMLAGDTFIGSVKEMNNNNVLLQLSNGHLLSARLTEQTNLQIGQNVTFLIESNQRDNISLKPMNLFQQENMLISKALDAANYPFTDANINIVKELLAGNMPLDAQTIGSMVKNSLKFPDASLNTIANLSRLEIPVTQENIIQFEAYRNFEHSMLSEMNQLPDQLSDAMMELMQKGSPENGVSFMNSVISMLYSESMTNPSSEIGSSAMESTANDPNAMNTATLESAEAEATSETANESKGELQSVTLDHALDQNQFTQLKEMLKGIFSNGEEPAFLQDLDPSKTTVKELLDEMMKALNGNYAGETSDADGTVRLAGDAQKMLLNKEGVRALLSSKEFKSLLGQAFDETMKLTPENVAKEDAINKYYKRVKATMEHISNEIEKELPDSKLLQNTDNIKNNIDFMNDLNKNMTFVQMPLKFSQSEANGELYVFMNKKALKNHSDQVSALLHLDMDHLGPMDIYVKLAGKNVSTNFCLESEEMLDFINDHIDELNQRLEALGYSSKFEMKVNDQNKEEKSFLQELVKEDTKNNQFSQYLFDTRA